MKEFITGKLGEVLAFAHIGISTMKKGRKGYAKLMENEEIDAIEIECVRLGDLITEFAKSKDWFDDVHKGARETEHKVSDMRDEYIEGNWDEASEVLEWLGFYTGAALVHWQLIRGACEKDELKELRSTADEAIKFYSGLISQDERKLRKIGAEKAS